jgi:uncharacterized protein involved in exopolysaccharide biosynthesis
MIATPSYQSVAVILPSDGATDVGVLGILVGVLGRSGSTTEGMPTSFLYVDILKSRTVLSNVLESEYEDYKNPGTKKDLYKLLHLPRNDQGFQEFKELLDIRSDFETGIITIKASAPNPHLAARIADNMIISLDNFNKNVRQTQAKKNRDYLETRLEEAYIQYQAILDTFVQFQKANRGYPVIRSPELEAQAEELDMRKKTKQDIYRLLNEELEMTKLTEAKTTPVVSVLDSASVPAEKASPKKIPIFILSLIASLIILFIWLFILEVNNPTSAEPPVVWAEIHGALKTDYTDVKAVFRRKK